MIEIGAITGLATVQDGGRPGHMHDGVPPGGPLVPELLGRANAAARNAPGEAAIEAFGGLTLVARAPVVLASDDGEARVLAIGEAYALRREETAVRYVAVRGGIAVPVVFGGRGTLLVSAFEKAARAARCGAATSCARATPLPSIDRRACPSTPRRRFQSCSAPTSTGSMPRPSTPFSRPHSRSTLGATESGRACRERGWSAHPTPARRPLRWSAGPSRSPPRASRSFSAPITRRPADIP